MRPSFSNRCAIHFKSRKPGLFLAGGLDYNNRQILPLMIGPVQGNDGSSLPSEAVMKRSRKSLPNSSANSGESAQGSTSVETRAERLARIKREIEAGTYETPEKLDAAIERMLGILAD
ncbi:hypothetical protein [Planctomicrobium sp. SH527]|uniref:hypothetical protein n=1 Tax=Planctomicrobium sp. SH527 TaxID=3448123 RepID=UPI003F5B58DF